jgi:hypothetical protein
LNQTMTRRKLGEGDMLLAGDRQETWLTCSIIIINNNI